MSKWIVLFALLVVSNSSQAQDTCETKCNQDASDCLKVCVGDPKSAAKKESAGRMMECLKSCDLKAKPCREACVPNKKPPAPSQQP